MNNMSESINMSRQQYIEWIPQIIYNHHQSGPAGTVVAGPPYRDPFNHVFDPLLTTSLDGVGAAMINRLHQEDRPGYTRLGGSVFSSWWNGGLRTTPYYQYNRDFDRNYRQSYTFLCAFERLIPNNANPYPITPQEWKFKNSIDYSVSLNYAILNHAVRHGDELLYNIYLMVEIRSNEEKKILGRCIPKMPKQSKMLSKLLKRKQSKKMKMLFSTGIEQVYQLSFMILCTKIHPKEIHVATSCRLIKQISLQRSIFECVDQIRNFGKSYPAGSYIVKTAQAFRPHVIDMFEPQDHPNDFLYPGGPPIRPYDAAGWTLAYQMGVEVDRIMEGFDGPFVRVPYGEIQSPPSFNLANSSGYLLDARSNNVFMVVNELLQAKINVFRTSSDQKGLPMGSFYVSNAGKKILEKAAKEYGVKPVAISGQPAGSKEIKPARIGLFDLYGGSMPSGWVRWMMEQFQFPYQLVFTKEIDGGQLNEKFDVLVFIGPGIPPAGSAGGITRSQPKAEEIDPAYHHMLGSISKSASIPQLKSFLQSGGKIITVGAATSLAYHLDLPVSNALVEMGSEGKEKALTGEKYYIPGSVLECLWTILILQTME
ncbi:LOW QUALITY PROTEIN: hypothetical protein GHT06_005787 [Daphnia sinensis]|uniref:Uncharacterized protein n=1 Tax=Daphnia sinensis TaxID=1820382 RepID=A0AAD5PMB9_9CRUS|nr:LOW QUALITY PROTEIN: hypothetical protein GHT06_005787 [Daphnia sinensis]